jgi:hypothetical protein
MEKTQVDGWHKCCCAKVSDVCTVHDAQGLASCIIIPEGHTVNKEMYIKILLYLRYALGTKQSV